jgi:hypothetical protein
MSAPDPIVEPDEVSDYYGLPCAMWGQCVTAPGENPDPVPAVFVSAHGGGEVDLHDLRLKLDAAERYAARILNAVAWQRARFAEQRAAELNEIARGHAATHQWGTKHNAHDGTTECTRCRTLVYDDDILRSGAVPPCGDRCPLSWHAITSVTRKEPGDAKCFHCHTVYTATAGEIAATEGVAR